MMSLYYFISSSIFISSALKERLSTMRPFDQATGCHGPGMEHVFLIDLLLQEFQDHPQRLPNAARSVKALDLRLEPR